MASASLSLSTHIFGSNLAVDAPPLPTSSVRFRQPPRVSAAYASASASASAVREVRYTASQSSLYEVLGVQMGATCREIKAAYRRLARVSHPDVASDGQKESSADEFIRIHAAYATLSDPEARADYDRTLFIGRRPVSSQFTMSAAATPVRTTSVSGFSGYSRRSWETDQCW